MIEWTSHKAFYPKQRRPCSNLVQPEGLGSNAPLLGYPAPAQCVSTWLLNLIFCWQERVLSTSRPSWSLLYAWGKIFIHMSCLVTQTQTLSEPVKPGCLSPSTAGPTALPAQCSSAAKHTAICHPTAPAVINAKEALITVSSPEHTVLLPLSELLVARPGGQSMADGHPTAHTAAVWNRIHSSLALVLQEPSEEAAQLLSRHHIWLPAAMDTTGCCKVLLECFVHGVQPAHGHHCSLFRQP